MGFDRLVRKNRPNVERTSDSSGTIYKSTLLLRRRTAETIEGTDRLEIARVLQGTFSEIFLSSDLDRQRLGNVVNHRIRQTTEKKHHVLTQRFTSRGRRRRTASSYFEDNHEEQTQSEQFPEERRQRAVDVAEIPIPKRTSSTCCFVSRSFLHASDRRAVRRGLG